MEKKKSETENMIRTEQQDASRTSTLALLGSIYIGYWLLGYWLNLTERNPFCDDRDKERRKKKGKRKRDSETDNEY